MNGRMKFNENVYTDRYTYIINIYIIYMTFSTFGKDVAYRKRGDTMIREHNSRATVVAR